MTNSQEVTKGTRFKSIVADGYVEFEVEEVGQVGRTKVAVAYSTNAHEYGWDMITKAFTVDDIRQKLVCG